ncbi:hypothetical protein F2P81_011818 [Scophthalmus maximus]|uniref:ribonuclease H n=1 Tax=Scophthalmus maximus TaxID=52904 RepID=A0A6A4SMU3_SCOMX|nr:hypothetical protein F2P81_011818 [Scophthalmus maximus]
MRRQEGADSSVTHSDVPSSGKTFQIYLQHQKMILGQDQKKLHEQAFEIFWWRRFMQYKEQHARDKPATQWNAGSAGKHMKEVNRNAQHAVKKCKKCGKDNHFAVKCRARPEQEKKRPVHNVTECDSDEYEELLCVTEADTENVNTVDTDKVEDTQLFAGMLLGKDVVKFQIDCGASCNIIPIGLLNPDTKLEATKTVLLTYNKSKLKPLGKCKVKLRNPGNKKLYQLEFQVVDKDCTVPLLGKRASGAMKLIKVQYENIMAIDSIVTTESKQWPMEQIKAEYAKLEEVSSYLTTFSTPFGCYRWLMMPMGISTAPEIFQRRLTQALEDLPCLYIIADDVLITGQGETQEAAKRYHDEKLRVFLNRCKQKNIKLNADKFKLRQKEVAYIGHLLTADGLKIDPEKCEVLRQLTHKDCEWNWTAQHEEAFLKLKETIANAPVLKYNSPDEELTVQCDASDTGLGVALMQKSKPVALASRALTQTERGYAQIEKESLVMVFSMYTYGCKVTVQSDHKPLETIVRKPLLSAPKRLQRMMLRIQKYDLDVVYVPGKDMLLGDTLSRAYLPECSSFGSVEAEIETVNMVPHLPISEDRHNAIRSATKEDKTLQILIKTMCQGWPYDKTKVSRLPSEQRPARLSPP